MRYSIAMMGGMVLGLLAEPVLGQVATMGGMGSSSVPAGNMNAGAIVANMGGNARFGAVQSGVGGGYESTTAASVVGSNLTGAGGYPLAAGDPRYFGQNSGTVAGMYGTGAAVANQAGQPFGLNRYRSMFTGGSVTNYNPPVQAAFGGPNNGQGYSGQSQGSLQGYAVPNYGWAAAAVANPAASRSSSVNIPIGLSGPPSNGLPIYTPRQYYNSAAYTYPTTNGLPPGSY